MPNYDLEMAESVIAARDLRIAELEAELAALEERRCETCLHFPHYHICKKDHRPVNWATFYCSEWAERGGE